MIGSTIAHYRVTAKLGEGGMGEVYRAADDRLGRDVAIKLLPESLSAEPDRLARFRREAQLLASLSHPNIGQIYGLEQEGGRSALVLELIEGETLDERLARGALPPDEAQRIALQIALALEAAHAKGIVHRDLKPANVKIAPDGTVKVLDFGLAKALEPEAAQSGPSPEHSPTLTAQATAAGIIMGTAAYMSPEQAKGEPADRRADVWALGVVLWEMLTGRPLFHAPTATEILAQVLTRDPDPGELPRTTPAATRRLLRRCLARDPRDRLHDVADARIVLAEILGGEAEEPAAAIPSAREPRRVWVWPVALLLAAGVSGLVGYRLAPRAPEAREPRHLAIHLGAGLDLLPDTDSLFAFSRDGTSVVFPGRKNGRHLLFRRDLGRREAEPITGTDNGISPFLSPDGRWIGFVANGQMMKIDVDGGTPIHLAEARGSGGANWLADDTVIFPPIYSDGLFRVPAAGGTPERLTTPDREDGELGHWWPWPLPGERLILFTAFRTPVDRSRVGVLDLETGDVRFVVEGGFFGRYVETGHLLYAKGHRLYAQPFDASKATTTGPAVPVVDDVAVVQTGGLALAAVAPGGLLAYVTQSLGNPLKELIWIDRDGRVTKATDERRRYQSVSLSPDDRRAALTVQGESRDLWTYSFRRGTLSRLTTGADTEFDPRWSADGRELFYVVDSPPFELYRIQVGNPDSGRPIWNERPEFDTTGIAVSPDGRTVAFTLSEPQTGENLYARRLDGSEPPAVVRATRAAESYAHFSPDGRWVVYQSSETGRPEIYVEPFPGPGERIQISADGGKEPLWARNGEIFYRQDDEFRVVATRPGQPFELDPPRTLHRNPIVPVGEIDQRVYDVTADGQRILAITIPEGAQPRQIEIVTDWAAQLPRLAPPAAR